MRTIITLLFCCPITIALGQIDTLRQVCFAKNYVLSFEQEEGYVLPEWRTEDEVFFIRMISKKELDQPKTMRWIKKKADKNCLSANQEDCLVWCQVEVPATYQITKDYIDETPENFSTKEFFSENFENLSGLPEWHPILCEELVDEEIVKQVIQELIYEEYLPEDAQFEMTEQIWAALFKFQINNKLPAGSLNLATLDFMNLEY